jgi:hypothetical protein
MMGAQLLEQHEVAGILHQHRIPRCEQDARQQVEGLARPIGGHDVGRTRRDPVLEEPRGDLLAQLRESLRRAGEPWLRAASAQEARQHAGGAGLEQPVLRQEARARRHDVAAVSHAEARERNGVVGGFRRRFHRDQRRCHAPLGDKEAAPGARLDQTARHQAVIGIDHGKGAGADQARELADRGQPRPGRQLTLPHELADARADLIDQGDG